jgi:hypothetical protein
MEFGTSADDNRVALSQDGDAPALRQSNCLRKPSWKVRDSIEYGEIALLAAYKVLASYFEPEIADEMMDPIAFLAKLSGHPILPSSNEGQGCNRVLPSHAGRSQ